MPSDNVQACEDVRLDLDLREEHVRIRAVT